MAAAASLGESSQPANGYRRPAARGIPRALWVAAKNRVALVMRWAWRGWARAAGSVEGPAVIEGQVVARAGKSCVYHSADLAIAVRQGRFDASGRNGVGREA